MRNVLFLALLPGRFRNDFRIRASLDDREHLWAECLADAAFQPFRVAVRLILNGIVQEGRDCLLFVGTYSRAMPATDSK